MCTIKQDLERIAEAEHHSAQYYSLVGTPYPCLETFGKREAQTPILWVIIGP